MPWISVSRTSLVVEDWNQVISIDEDFTSILGVDAQAAFLSNMFTSKIWWTDEQLRFFKILFDGQGADSSLFFTVYTKWYNDYLWAHLQHFLIVFCWGPLICSLKILIWINVFLSFFRSFSDNFQLQISLRTKKALIQQKLLSSLVKAETEMPGVIKKVDPLEF